jgi:hypothetical protein
MALNPSIHQIPWLIPIAIGTWAIDIPIKDVCIDEMVLAD